MAIATYTAQGGDSGGIVYRNGGMNVMFTQGMHLGATTFVTPGTLRPMFIPVQNVLTALDVRLFP